MYVYEVQDELCKVQITGYARKPIFCYGKLCCKQMVTNVSYITCVQGISFHKYIQRNNFST